MKAVIKHEIPGMIRVHFSKPRFSYREADTLQYYLEGFPFIEKAVVYERTADAVIVYSGDRDAIIRIIREYSSEKTEVPESVFESSSRELNAKYYEDLVTKTVWHYGKRLLVPVPVRTVLTCLKSLSYIWRGLKTIPEKKLKVELLDAIAISASVLVKDYSTASSVMLLLGIGDTLEEWTHKKCATDLARQMSLNISRVWKVCGTEEVLTDADRIVSGDQVVIRMGNIIPFDGVVTKGDAMVNQASMTGEAIPVRKEEGGSVFAGTVVEEGEITVRVTAVGGNGRYDKIVRMIEESEKLKSGLESKAEGLADRLVPYTLAGAALTFLLGRNVTKAVSVLMVDYSCALKLAMPISVLSAIREAGENSVTVKGGKFLEAVSEADVIVFDKTGTLTKAEPTVKDVVSFNGESSDELLREAACLEEHFPHSIANAVVKAAADKGLTHEEFHTKVEYVVAHGISSEINGNRALIGSYHFVFEDEGVSLPEDKKAQFEALPDEYSHLYYAKDGRLAAVILIEDPLREDAARTVNDLRKQGISRIVMMTGDSERTAKRIASLVGVDEYHSEVLPEDKAGFVEAKKKDGYKVIMIGDGINDSPALSAADAGIAISDGAEIARQIADITIGGDDLKKIVMLKALSDKLMKRIRFNYRTIVGFNSGLILLGLMGVLSPSASALLHNTSTIVLGLNSTTKLLKKDCEENK
ncbi:ATPase, P-type (transporting), HAD superfamily, subfamily IC/heavy metal translocating P-type ATPase [Lachnospiraceae bacterium XPB1003]|nr:ATPase, P-type (transporting), HAD superfamily, subfamily IC/heavy metal translocating P-type ATPase [Lachnospiraceae bacterium XPB1003]